MTLFISGEKRNFCIKRHLVAAGPTRSTNHVTSYRYDTKYSLDRSVVLWLVAGVITDAIKDAVGRPRPDLFWRCFPDGRGEEKDEIVCYISWALYVFACRVRGTDKSNVLHVYVCFR
ncbi:Phosphatidic acid phosphatase type 2/haloperoxidase protein [Raphanus sativus]|nr:Phosphatidic acid phosphatase type 2/haloperoxidase protein [Raphanus sativus]